MHFAQGRNWDAICLQKLNFALISCVPDIASGLLQATGCQVAASPDRTLLKLAPLEFQLYAICIFLRYSESYLTNRRRNCSKCEDSAQCRMIRSIYPVTGPGKSTLFVVHCATLSVSIDQWFSTCGTRTPWGYAVRAQKSLDLTDYPVKCL
jgi:hypothetical protein